MHILEPISILSFPDILMVIRLKMIARSGINKAKS